MMGFILDLLFLMKLKIAFRLMFTDLRKAVQTMTRFPTEKKNHKPFRLHLTAISRFAYRICSFNIPRWDLFIHEFHLFIRKRLSHLGCSSSNRFCCFGYCCWCFCSLHSNNPRRFEFDLNFAFHICSYLSQIRFPSLLLLKEDWNQHRKDVASTITKVNLSDPWSKADKYAKLEHYFSCVHV